MREFLRHPETIAALLLTAHIFLVAVAAVLVSVNRRPSSAIAWILAMIFIPVPGAIVFFFVGSAKLPKGRRDKQREVNALVLSRTAGSPVVSQGDDWPEWLHSAVALNNNLGALPMVQGNRAELLPDYNGAFDAMIVDIDRARNYVHVEFYILALDPTTRPLFQALARAATRGVAVRVLSDHLAGLMFPGRKETLQYLQEMGAHYHPMIRLRPLPGQWQRPDLRNHRKILVVDGREGFTGSQNLIDARHNKKGNLNRGLQWHELMMRIEGRRSGLESGSTSTGPQGAAFQALHYR